MDRIASTACSIALFVLLLAPSTGHAEFFVDLRGGYAFTDDDAVEFSIPGAGSSGLEVDLDDSPTGGGRVGYWLGFFPWLGVAADISYFGPDIDFPSADIDVIPVTPMLMGRLPIAKEEEYRYGRVQPFIGVGPGIFVTSIDDDVDYSDDALDVGLDVHAGLKVLVTPWLGLFAQYRYTSFEAQYSDSINFLGTPVKLETDVDLDTHHVAGGFAFHF